MSLKGSRLRISLTILAVQAVLPLAQLFSSLHVLVVHVKAKSRAPASVNAVHHLSAGEQIRRELLAGKRHSYSFAATAGRYLRFIIEGHNVDLKISVSDSGHNKLLELNGRRYGPTPVSVIADSPGSYRLELHAVRAEPGTANYELKIEAEAVTSTENRNYLAAERMFMEAEKLYAEGKPDSLLSAINKYEEAITYWTAAGDIKEEAYALKCIGDAYGFLMQREKAIEYYSRALQASQTAGYRELEVEVLNDLAGIENNVNQPEKALEYCTSARMLSQEIGCDRGEARALDNIGLNHYSSGNMRQATDFFEQSLSIWATADNRRGEAQTLINIGYACADLGETTKAIDYFKQALDICRSMKDLRGQVLSLGALGLTYTWLGEKQKAFDAHKEALRTAESLGDKHGQAVNLNGIGYFYSELGEKQKALECHINAAQLFRDIGNRDYEAFTTGYAGNIHFALGDIDKALVCYQQELEICRRIQDHRMEAYTLRDIGTVHNSLGDVEEALSNYNSALALSRQADDARGQAYILNNLGMVYGKQGDNHRALAYYKEALALLQAVHDKGGEIITIYNIARIKRELGDLAEAGEQIKTALSMIEKLRANIISKDMRASYLASTHQCYEFYIDLLMRMHKENPQGGFDVTALEINERARARSLLEMLTEARTDIRQGVNPSLLRKERELQQLLNRKAERHTLLLSQSYYRQTSSESGNTTENTEVASLTDEIKKLITQIDEVEAEIRTGSPKYAALTQPEAFKVDKLQQLLDANTLVLEYSMGDERSYVWAVTRNSVTSYELPGRKEIEKASNDFYQLIVSLGKRDPVETSQEKEERLERTKTQLAETANQLCRMIITPVAQHLITKRLVIVADGALQYLPFAALPNPNKSAIGKSPQQALLINHEISTLPSLSTLAVIRKEIGRRKRAPKVVAILADPVYDADDNRIKQISRSGNDKASNRGAIKTDAEYRRYVHLERSYGESLAAVGASSFHRLPFARREAIEIAKIVPARQRKLATDFKASRTLALSAELDKYRIIHFATHGLLNNVHPELSGIVLSLVSEKGYSQDGFLRLNEVYNMKLRADLVVLSACQTALGKEIKGEGLIGLTRGFMYAGASRVTATLWRVDDRASSELMKYFYRAMLGRKRLRPSAALRTAQITLMKQQQFNSPYYWAAYVLQGEWR